MSLEPPGRAGSLPSSEGTDTFAIEMDACRDTRGSRICPWNGAALARGLLAGILVVAAAWPSPARGEFGNIRRVFSGTAYTLEQGELAVGIFSPLQYGLLDHLTVSTHPILDLLLTPNVALRYKVLDQSRVALGLGASYMQSFLSVGGGDAPGAVSAFPTLSLPFSDEVSLSLQGGYTLDIGPVRHGALYGANLGWLIGPADLLWIAVQGRYRFGPGIEMPTVMLSYTHAWYQVRLSVGLAVGRFPTQIGSKVTDLLDFPVYPVIDVWWLL